MQAVDAGKRKYVRIVPTVLGFFSAVLLSFTLFVMSAFLVLYCNPGFFQREYEKYDVLNDMPVEMSMSREDGLLHVTEHMMDFLLHGQKAEELQVEAVIDGQLQPFFTEQELSHMMDVRDIFMICIRFAAFCFVGAAMLLIISRLAVCHDEPKIFRLSSGIGIVSGAAAVITALLGFIYAAATDFSMAFLKMHEMLFSNTDWLMDPRKNMLVNIVPEGFFSDTAFLIGIVFAALIILMLSAGILLIRSAKKMPDYQFTSF